MKMLRYGITGTGRCGTVYATKWLKQCGRDIGHESLGRDGACAFELAAMRPLFIEPPLPQFGRMLHIVREPLKCISSWQTASKRSWQFVSRNSQTQSDAPIVRRCMQHWYYWNLLAESRCERTVPIERWGLDTVADFFDLDANRPEPQVPRNTNTRKGKFRPLTWSDLERADAGLTEQIRELAMRYGYDVPRAGIRRRIKQADYRGYLRHQAKKMNQPRWRRKLHKERSQRVQWFRRIFQGLVDLPEQRRRAVCLGARYGEECEALHREGFSEVVGIDLEDYPPYVQKGDMNATGLPNGHYDLVYTNAFDHCWDAGRFAEELCRLVAPGGILVLHLTEPGDEAYRTQLWKDHAAVAGLFAGRMQELRNRPLSKPFYGLEQELVFRK